MNAAEKGALILALWVGLSGIWFNSSARAQSDEYEEVSRLVDQVQQLYEQGKYAEAIPIARRILIILDGFYGPDHPNVAGMIKVLGGLYKLTGKYFDAEPLLNRSLAIEERIFGPDNLNLAIDLTNLAGLHYEKGIRVSNLDGLLPK